MVGLVGFFGMEGEELVRGVQHFPAAASKGLAHGENPSCFVRGQEQAALVKALPQGPARDGQGITGIPALLL